MRLLRSDSGKELWSTPRGQFWVHAGRPSQMLDFVLAEESLDIYRSAGIIHAGDVVLDCGADVGTFARVALQCGAAKVVSIEPSPAKQECLRLTFADEIREGRVSLCPKGVWSEESTMRLDDDTLSQTKDVSVPLTTVDRIVTDLGLTNVNLVKMDIEGAEEHAITGARDTIRHFKPKFTIATEHRLDDHSRMPLLPRQLVPEIPGFLRSLRLSVRPPATLYSSDHS